MLLIFIMFQAIQQFLSGSEVEQDIIDCIQSIKKISKKHKKFLSFLTEQKYSQKVSDNPVNHSSCPEPLPSGVKKVPARQAWEKSKSVSLEQCKPVSAALQGNDFEYTAKIRTLAETERFFDELTKEKDQVKLIKYKKKPLPEPNAYIQREQSEGNY